MPKYESWIFNKFFVVQLCFAIVVALASAFISPIGAAAQGKDAYPGLNMEKMLESGSGQSKISQITDEKSVYDGVVDAEYYHVGPGDVFSLFIVPYPALEQYVSMTPENTLVLPRIGEVSLRSKTLQQAKAIVDSIVKRRNPNAEATLSLVKPRTVFVTVSGNVRYGGTYSLSAGLRASTAVRLANQSPPGSGQQSSSLNAQLSRRDVGIPSMLRNQFPEQDFSPFVARNIRVFHRDGNGQTIDLEAERAGLLHGDHNPCLREGDVVHVPFEQSSYPIVGLRGAVLRQTTLAFKPGDKASLLLKCGLGATADADLTNIRVFLRGADNFTVISADNMLNLLSPDFELTEGATIVVEKQQRKQENLQHGVVETVGEVQQPGTLVIELGKTRLRDVIEKAGGFTDRAYLPLAYVVRRNLAPTIDFDPKATLQKSMQFSDLATEDTSRFFLHSQFRQPLVSCDFQQAFSSKSSESQDNIVLEDGDIVVVPKSPKRVYVYGQVNKPGYVEFQENKPLSWYINRAGGYSVGGTSSSVRLIKGKNFVWMEGNSDAAVDAGDSIYAPPPPLNPPGYDIQSLAAIAGLTSAALGLTFTLISFFRN